MRMASTDLLTPASCPAPPSCSPTPSKAPRPHAAQDDTPTRHALRKSVLFMRWSCIMPHLLTRSAHFRHWHWYVWLRQGFVRPTLTTLRGRCAAEPTIENPFGT